VRGRCGRVPLGSRDALEPRSSVSVEDGGGDMKERLKRISIALAAVVPLLAVPASAQDATTGDASLATLVKEALDRNPEIQAIGKRVAAKRARVPQAGALPDPMAMYGVMNEGKPVPFQTLGKAGFSEVYLGVSQDLPFPGKRRLREQVARDDVSVEEMGLQATQRRVASDIAQAFYELYAVQAASQVVDQHRSLLEELTKVASTRFSVGEGTQHDVLNAQVELSQVLERASLLVQRRETQGALLAALVARPQAIVPLTHAVLTVTPVPGLDDVLGRALEASPTVRQKVAAVRQAEQRVALARRERLPDLGFNVTYHNRGGLDPYYSYGGTVTLPIYTGRKQAKAVDEAAAELEAAQHEAEAARNQVRYEVTEAYRMAEIADRLVQLYREGILKQARLALDSAVAQYRVGRVDFLTLVSSWRRLLDSEITYHEQLAAHEKAVARISMHVDGLVPYQPSGERER
jgi:outer membrane protein, heavy metal efflux system